MYIFHDIMKWTFFSLASRNYDLFQALLYSTNWYVSHGTSPESEKNKTEKSKSHPVNNKSNPEPLRANKFGKVEQVTRAATMKVPRTTKSLDVTYTR